MTDKLETPKLSREHFSVVPLGDKSDKKYWRSRSVEERLEYMEYLRWINYGDAVFGRLQRVFEVVKRLLTNDH